MCIDGLYSPVLTFYHPDLSNILLKQLGLGYTEFFGNFTAMMDRIAGHLSYLSKYASAAFEGSVEIQEVCTEARNPLRFLVSSQHGTIYRLWLQYFVIS